MTSVDYFAQALAYMKLGGTIIMAEVLLDIPLPEYLSYGGVGGIMLYAYRMVSKAKDATSDEVKTQNQYLRDENARLRDALEAAEKPKT